MKQSGSGIAPPIERGCGARQTMAPGHFDWGRVRLAVTIERVAEALLVEEAKTQNGPGIVRAHGVMRP
jgi:hypothetical protein